jgi:DNA-binding IclR family transcriptional regulator
MEKQYGVAMYAVAPLRFTYAYAKKRTMTGNKRKTTVQSLQRGLEILVAVAKAEQAVGITELSRQFGLAKGSISRLVTTLVQQSFLTRDPETAKYRISSKVWELGSGAVSRLDVRGIARPVMERLNAATHETVHLTILTESDEMVFLDKLDSTRGVRPNVELGVTLPPYCVSNGKAVLAFLPKARVDRVLRGKLRRFTKATITRKSELFAQLDTVRRLGYAVNRGEYRPDVAGVAAPIRDHTGLAVAALGVSIPSVRMTPELISDLARRVVASAREISSALGERREPVVPLKLQRPPVAGRINNRIRRTAAPAQQSNQARSNRRTPSTRA